MNYIIWTIPPFVTIYIVEWMFKGLSKGFLVPEVKEEVDGAILKKGKFSVIICFIMTMILFVMMPIMMVDYIYPLFWIIGYEETWNVGKVVLFLVIECFFVLSIIYNGKTILRVLTGKPYIKKRYCCIPLSVYGLAITLCIKSFAQLIGCNAFIIVAFSNTRSSQIHAAWIISLIIYYISSIIHAILYCKNLTIYRNGVVVGSNLRKKVGGDNLKVVLKHDKEANYSVWVGNDNMGQVIITPQNLQTYKEITSLTIESNDQKGENRC